MDWTDIPALAGGFLSTAPAGKKSPQAVLMSELQGTQNVLGSIRPWKRLHNLYINTDWFLSYLRYVQCRLLNDRLPQGLSSSIFFPLLFLLPFVQYHGFKWDPTNNKPDHNSYHWPSLYSIPDTFSFLFSIKTHFAEKLRSIYTSLTNSIFNYFCSLNLLTCQS